MAYCATGKLVVDCLTTLTMNYIIECRTMARATWFLCTSAIHELTKRHPTPAEVPSQ